MDPSLSLSDGESDDESSSSTVRKTYVILRMLEFASQLKELGMKDSNHVTVEEIVATFLYVLSFNLTNRKVSFDFIRSGDTASRYFNMVLQAVLKLGGNMWCNIQQKWKDSRMKNGTGLSLIRVEEPNDPLLEEVDHELLNRVNPDGDDQNEEEQNQPNMQGGANVEDSDRITLVQSTHEWTRFRDALAQAMFIDYQNRRR
ncbi:OLC1v1008573C1 [Oldenlandia corymbosa var. corymbosa]|uniref:OLC1v1008573C1 n=1 Tax=Oldenlandia corymbosa var. corymbosa TaxID=529605 RepID=A0AAV1DQ62_OLDCO|nr:OLC1v1008573C1 [Oldenlandia corymbosa var. corymbosa]